MEIGNIKAGDKLFIPNHTYGRVDQKRVRAVLLFARAVQFDDWATALCDSVFDSEEEALMKVVENIDYWQEIMEARRDECQSRLSQIEAVRILDAADLSATA
jgi:hypothetical protein